MEANVKKEIADLRIMVRRWYDFYLKCADGHKYDQVHVEEFEYIVETHLLPHLQRLRECKHLDQTELGDFHGWLGKKHSDLSIEISKVKPPEKTDPVITLLKNLELTDKQRQAVVDYLK